MIVLTFFDNIDFLLSSLRIEPNLLLLKREVGRQK